MNCFRSYCHPGLRLLLLAVLLVGAWLVLAGPAAAQSPSAAPADMPPPPSIWTVIPLDWITVLLGLLSFLAVTLIVQAFIQTRQSVFMPAASLARMRMLAGNRQLAELVEFTETDGSFVARVLHPALKRAPSFPAMKEGLETAAAEQTANAFRKIEYLNILGNLGPLLGLLGTVMGMMEAFAVVRAAGGQADVTVLSGGIANALSSTFLGLGLAIPCLAAFGVLRTLTDRLTVEGALKAEELLIQLQPPEARDMDGKPATASPLAAPAAPLHPIPQASPALARP